VNGHGMGMYGQLSMAFLPYGTLLIFVLCSFCNCLFVCEINDDDDGPRNNLLDFGGNLDHCPDPGFF